MANVVSHERFKLDPAGVEHLRALGVEIKSDFPDEKTLGLIDPQFSEGEKVLGTLTDEEFAVFVEIWRCQAQLSNIGKTITSRKLREAADMVMDTENPQDFLNDVKENARKPYTDDEEAAVVFELRAKMTFLKGLFYWQMGEKYDCHAYRTGIRSGRRFVLKDRRY